MVKSDQNPNLVPIQPWHLAVICFVSFLFFNVLPASAHHAMSGRMPSNFWEGFLSGLAHPIVGLDHFAFIVAVGLLAALKQRGIGVAVAFVLMTMAGTGLHLMQIAIPGVELLVSGSILLFGILLVMKDSPNTGIVAGLSVIAGLFHGYAYGEAIFGAQMTPLLSYLIGFSVTQAVIAILVFGIGKIVLRRSLGRSSAVNFRSVGWMICGVGLTFLASQVMEILLPAASA